MSTGASVEFVRRIRLAISDPGAIVDRRDNYQEKLLSWQGRAVMRVIYTEQRADLEQARSITVALEQENARLRALAATLADRWVEVSEGMRTQAAAAEPDDLIGHVRAERSLILRSAARDLRWLLANGTIPHWLMTSEELGEPDADEPSGGAS